MECRAPIEKFEKCLKDPKQKDCHKFFNKMTTCLDKNPAENKLLSSLILPPKETNPLLRGICK